jgi:hypothetical protein
MVEALRAVIYGVPFCQVKFQNPSMDKTGVRDKPIYKWPHPLLPLLIM